MKERELIATSRTMISKTKNLGSRKIMLFKQAKNFCEQYIKVDDLDKFSEGFRDYLYNALKKKSNGSLDSVGYVKLVTLYDINDEQLKRLEIEYKKLSKIELNDTYTEVAEFDAGVYAETPDELRKLKQYKDIEKAVNALQKKDVPVHWGNLSRAFYPITAINGQRLEPNINYIKNNRL